MGSFCVKAILFFEASSIFIGITFPESFFKTSIQQSTPSIPLLISISESVIGFPPSEAASEASSVKFLSIRCEKFFKTLILSSGGKSRLLLLETV